LPDAALLRLVTAFRITFPQVAIVLSTREPAPLRDAMAPLGVTHMSAGARTEPGGYTGAGSDDLHLTVKGRRVELSVKSGQEKATEQFQIHDTRSPAQVAEMLRHQDIDPVWKDFDQVLVQA
jgi:2-iminoacetate synthase